MNIKECISKLDSEEWKQFVPIIEERLKKELQTSKGFINLISSETNINNKEKIKKLVNSFINVRLNDLDEKINEFTTKVLEINKDSNITLQYDLINTVLHHNDLSKYKNLSIVKEEILKRSLSSNAAMRLTAILFKISNQSISQRNKSNAGVAGESFVNAIFTSVGLILDKHYREQYKSETGSDTDFAFPFVNDYNDSQLEVLIAVQMSTNDRARLTSSELKHGVRTYVVTGNGLDASSKKLKDIGTQIISTYHKSNIRIVCCANEINKEKNRIENLIHKDPSNKEYKSRLNYFKNSAFTFAEFAKSMEKYRYQ
jgi:hypothetical protein